MSDQDPSLIEGRPMPASSRIVARWRDALVLALPSADTKPATLTHTALIFDRDADFRIIDVFMALHYRNVNIRKSIIALAESQGRVQWWHSDPNTVEFARRPLQEACNAALWPYDRWTTEVYQLAPMLPDGTLDRANLPADSLLRVVPERITLGRVPS